MHFERNLVATLARALSEEAPVFQVMTGPRQVGKTTIARQIMAKLPFPSVYASADSPLPLGPEWIDTQFRLAELEKSRTDKPVLLVLDEVQKVRGWGEILKKYWDGPPSAGKEIRLLVLGSSALLLQEGPTKRAHCCNGLPKSAYTITYWRDGDKEVDFVITSGSAIWAVEVKSARGGKASGMEKFIQKYPAAKPLLIGAAGIPLEKFFSEPAATWFS